MPPLKLHQPQLLPRDPPSSQDTNNQASLAMSPSLIVGICILAAIFFCVILASIIRLCSAKASGPETTENPFKPHDPTQLERLQEVRRINNKLAWERGHWARLELVKMGRRVTGHGIEQGQEGMETSSWGEGEGQV